MTLIARPTAALVLATALHFSACSPSPGTGTDQGAAEEGPVSSAATHADGGALVTYTEERASCDHRTPTRLPLFGDLHVHTRLYFDAAANTIGATPEDAYRYGRGE